MSTKYVTYTSSVCLPCAGRGTAALIMCTRFDQTVPGQLIESCTGTCTSGYSYNIQYDSTDLPAGVTALASIDITGVVCEGCLTTWIREKFVSRGTEESVDDTQVTDLIALEGQSDGYISTVDYVITNPSDIYPLRALVTANWMLQLEGTAAFQAGINADFLIDGAASGVGGIDASAAGAANSLYFSAGGGSLPVLVSAGDSVTFTIQFTANISVEPDTTYRIKNIVISVFGAV